MASLALGVAQRVLAIRLAASGHGSVLRDVTQYNGPRGGRGPHVGTPGEFVGLHFRGDGHAAARCLRRLSPFNSIRCALCRIRSRMASASVGLPTISYQRSIGTWLVMISEPAL